MMGSGRMIRRKGTENIFGSKKIFCKP